MALLDPQEYAHNVKVGSDYMWTFLKQARKDFAFSALQQWDQSDKEQLQEQMRPALVFDLTRPLIKAVAGAEQTARFKASFLGFNTTTEDNDRWAAEAFNYMYSWIREHGGLEHHESLAFQDLAICGLACLDTFVDFSENPNGLILTKRVPIFDAGFDPAANEPNLQDRWWCFRDRMIPEKQFERLYPEGKDILSAIRSDTGQQDGSNFMKTINRRIGRAYSRATGGQDDGQDSSMGNKADGAVRLREYQWKEVVFRTRVMLRDPESGRIMEEQFALPKDVNDVVQEFEGMGQQMQEEQAAMMEQAPEEMQGQMPSGGAPFVDTTPNFPQTKYFRAHMVGKHTLAEEQTKYRDFTLQFLTGEEDWSSYVGETGSGFRKFFGLMKAMRDPQSYRNKFFSQAVHLFNANPKGVLLYETDMFENPQSALDAWNKAEGAVPIEPGMLSGPHGAKFQHINQSYNFSGVAPLLSTASSAVGEAAGINASYFGGQADDLKRTATSAVDFVSKQNMASLSNYFDALRMYRKTHARLALDMCKEHFPKHVIERILGPRMKDRAEFFFDLEIQDYDIVVSEVEDKPTASHQEFAAVAQFLPQALELGFPLPASIFEDVAGFLKPETAAEWTGQIKEFMAAQKAQQQAAAQGGGEQPPAEGEEAPSDDVIP